MLFLLSFLLTALYRYFALSKKVLDIPNERSSHDIPTPKGGGVAIVLTWYSGITVFYFLNFIPENLYFALTSGIFLALISYIDDLIELNPVVRFIAQVCTALLSLYFIGGVGPLYINDITIIPSVILFPLATIGIVWFINIFNFLDGIDGYASLEASIISLVIFIFTKDPVCLVLLVCILGFIPWNWPKAKIFMGDVGSTQLGFILIVLGLYFRKESEFSIVHWMMLSSLFWFDATLTLYRRWRNNEKLSTAHKKHAYQRIVQSGFSHQKTICLSLLINAIIVGLIFVSFKYKSLLIPAFVINILFLYAVSVLIDRRLPFHKE